MKKRIFIAASCLISALIAILMFYLVFTAGYSKKSAAGPTNASNAKILNNADDLVAKGSDEEVISNLHDVITARPESNEAAAAFLMLGSIYEKRGEILKAKAAYLKVLEKFPASDSVSKAEEAIGDLNVKALFSRIATPQSTVYEIRKGDTLEHIAKRFATTVGLISRTNGLNGHNIKYGKKLKISTAKFSIVVDKSQNILTLRADGEIFKTYRAATGLNNSTPAGKFNIVNKAVNPTWYTDGAVIPPGDPKNILGTRWMGISKEGYGIHGTTSLESIGKSVTSGCVRMANSDVEELYTIVPIGTEVEIVD